MSKEKNGEIFAILKHTQKLLVENFADTQGRHAESSAGKLATTPGSKGAGFQADS